MWQSAEDFTFHAPCQTTTATTTATTKQPNNRNKGKAKNNRKSRKKLVQFIQAPQRKNKGIGVSVLNVFVNTIRNQTNNTCFFCKIVLIFC